jgi:hypothetical protein
MIFPKLLRGVLACDAFEDFGTAWVFVYEACLELLLASSFFARCSLPIPRPLGRKKGRGERREGGKRGMGGNEREQWWVGKVGGKGGQTSNIINIFIDYYIHAVTCIFV